MSRSHKRQKERVVLELPSQFESYRRVRKAPIPGGRFHAPKKGGGFDRNQEKRELRKEHGQWRF